MSKPTPRQQTPPPAPQEWEMRFAGEDIVDPEQLLANPFNARVHNHFQEQALKGVVSTVGWVQRVIVNIRTGHVVDGHLRVSMAITNRQRVPVQYVDLTDQEEKAVLASLDWITSLAGYDMDILKDLLNQAESEHEALQSVLTNLAASKGLVEGDDPYAEWQGMPEFINEDASAPFTVKVHFMNEQDIAAFAALVQQVVTPKTKFIYYPPQKPEDLKKYRVRDGGHDP